MACLLSFLGKVYKCQISMTFSCWSMILFSRWCLDPDDANVSCNESFLLSSSVLDKFRYPWWFACNATMNQVQLPAGDFHTGHMTSSYMFASIFLNTIELRPPPRCRCVSLAMTKLMICNMTYLGHSSGHVIWSELRLNFQIDLSGLKCWLFDASRREEYDDIKCFLRFR